MKWFNFKWEIAINIICGTFRVAILSLFIVSFPLPNMPLLVPSYSSKFIVHSLPAIE
jgi:hypothetical protein